MIGFEISNAARNLSLSYFPQITSPASGWWTQTSALSANKPTNLHTESKKRSASDQKLIDQANQQKAKEEAAKARAQGKQQQTQQGKQKEGKSNKETRGNHDSGNKSKRQEEETMRMQTPEEQKSRPKQIRRRKNQRRRTEMTKDKFDLLLYKYRETVAIDSVKARRYFMQLDYKNNFYLLKCIAQTYLDESLFEYGSNKMRTEVDQRKWRMAEKYIVKAFKINDDHAETLYTMGKIRKTGDQNHIADYCFKTIIKLGVNRIAKQEYSRGRYLAKMLVNDARFELYRLYFYTDKKKSSKYLKEFKADLKKGVETIFHPLNKFLLFFDYPVEIKEVSEVVPVDTAHESV